jgi:kojibiose phosphorylase
MYIDQFNIDKNWCVIEDSFDINNVRHNESVMALGTGFLTIRSGFDEGFSNDEQNLSYDRMAMNVSLEVVPAKKSRWGAFIPLVQGKHPFWNVGVINLPYMLGLEVYADGEKLDMETGKITDYKRWLDMKTATLYRTFIWETVTGKKLNLLFKRYMNPVDKFLCVQELKINALSGSFDVTLNSYIDNDVRTNGYDKFTNRTVAFGGDQVIYSDVTGNLGDRIMTVSRMVTDKTVSHTIKRNERRITAGVSFRLSEKEEACVRKISVQAASVYFDSEALLDEGIKMINKALEKSADDLHAAHVERWTKNWDISDIQIEADEEAPYNSQRAIRQAIYHLFRARSTDPRALNCAKGSTSEMYLGSVCWDMEIFFQPFYIYTQPELAKMTGLYRYGILDGARRSAKNMNYTGARYPWQTDRYGNEVCPLFEYADHEVHISADIVVGLWHYYLNTLDKDYLYNYGLEIIIETSRYWATRATRINDRAGWHIYGVMGPDEYKPISNNNAYTNFVVRENLRLVDKVVSMCKSDAPDAYKKLRSKINFNEKEIALFNEIADNLPLPKDEKRQIIWQCDDFDTAYGEIDIEGLWKDKNKLFGYYTTQELRYRSKCLKQSDVIALMGLYTEAFTKEEMTASYDYYTPYTIHDSSNSICHNTIVSAYIGRKKAAYENWKKSIDIDFGPRPRSSEGIHFANVGGMWQEIVLGFGGMVNALCAETLTLKPCMPDEIKKISFQVIWKGQRAFVTVTRTTVTVKNMSNKDLSFIVYGKTFTATSGSEATSAY